MTNNLQQYSLLPAAVVVGFFVCWAPFHAQRLLAIYGHETSEEEEETLELVFYLTGIAYYLQSTMNPILYNIMSDRYRIAFREILCRRGRPRRTLIRSSTFRETRIVSQSEVQNNAYNIRSQKCSVGLNDKDEDKVQLMDQEIITVSTPKCGSTLIYEINFTKDSCDCHSNMSNCETCI